MSDLFTETYNFDDWVSLAKNNPQNFEQLRAKVVSQCIKTSATENQQRLRCLQWRIDHMRKKSSAMRSYTEIARLMWENFDSLRNSLNTLPGKAISPSEAAEIIPFPNPEK